MAVDFVDFRSDLVGGHRVMRFRADREPDLEWAWARCRAAGGQGADRRQVNGMKAPEDQQIHPSALLPVR
ncbi:hypothetical protein AAFF_G00409620 [Aldrovandia affinis]|uniref:Uncharacterized protein n=1 Tax=Aldrovandia affinis TaxID=143900 RepID=A0AAD7WJQ0_9TELE|nr:hypothetical protein AAFF_G00409620 [Aldrovandia affinis]